MRVKQSIFLNFQGVEDDYCNIQDIHEKDQAYAGSKTDIDAVMYPEGGYFNSALQSEEDYVKVV